MKKLSNAREVCVRVPVVQENSSRTEEAIMTERARETQVQESARVYWLVNDNY